MVFLSSGTGQRRDADRKKEKKKRRQTVEVHAYAAPAGTAMRERNSMLDRLVHDALIEWSMSSGIRSR